MKLSGILVYLSLVAAIYAGNPAQSANIIFDMNGVLSEASIGKSLWYIGPTRLIGLFNPFQIQETLFDFLHRVKPLAPSTPHALYRNKFRLPQIMCDWLTGSLDSLTIIRMVNNYMDRVAPTIDSQRKVALVRGMTSFMFDPEKLIGVTRRIDKGYKLLKRCAREVDEHGNKAHRIFILTNWDAESWPLLIQNPRFKRMLDLVDGIIVSGQVHMMKPDPALFEYAFNTWGIDPDREFTVYIDDELCNITGAESLHKEKLLCVHCTGDYKALKKELKRRRVLKSNY